MLALIVLAFIGMVVYILVKSSSFVKDLFEGKPKIEKVQDVTTAGAEMKEYPFELPTTIKYPDIPASVDDSEYEKRGFFWIHRNETPEI